MVENELLNNMRAGRVTRKADQKDFQFLPAVRQESRVYILGPFYDLSS